ncbi:DUF5686 and carboxypeptidase regulatory-like domain-containing protein [Sphingobacterium hungaricum]
MSKFFWFLVFLFPAPLLAQVSGKVTNNEGLPMPYVSVTVEGTYIGTSTNSDGNYQLKITKAGKYVLLFQSLGYKTTRLTIQANELPFVQNAVLEQENLTIEEVVIQNNENPADRIMRKAIAEKEKNSAKNDKYHADFYSRGNIKLTKMPKVVQNDKSPEVKELMDTTNSGYIYLSETFSKISFQKPNKLYENIIASKLSGNDRGYSFNTAIGSNFDFYTNYVNLGTAIISPLADIAFTYYSFRLESSFEAENKTIYKIKVIAKRDKEPVVEGYVYIADGTYEIYAVDFNLKGYRMNQPFMNQMKITQHYSFNQSDNRWVKNSQFLDFDAGFLGFEFRGSFSSNFSNYEFVSDFEKGTFGKTVVNIEKEANLKDSAFWESNRPIPLLTTEIKDYFKKDSVQKVRNSPAYIDSVDRSINKFKLSKLFLGYTYQNTPSKYSIHYSGLLNVTSINFNTIQGWNAGIGFDARFGQSDEGKLSTIQSTIQYGFSDQRLRADGLFRHRFNTQNYSTLELSAGNKVFQFNSDNPVIPIVNMFTSLVEKRNYIKLYESSFAKINYRQDVWAGLSMNASLSYQNRQNLFNTTDYSFWNKERSYSSNNPLLPDDYTTAAFSDHSIFKFNIGAVINFGEKFVQRPDRKVSISNRKYPTFEIDYTQAFASSLDDYNYSQIEARLRQSIVLGNKGVFEYNLIAGKLFNGENAAFMDYKHFNGNQVTTIVSKPYIQSFFLLPYYDYSTNKPYIETHLNHNFKGFIMNKIPVISELQWHLNLGHNFFATEEMNYQEFTIGFSNVGFGKYRLFRIDYVRSFNSHPAANKVNDGFVFGINF